MHLFGAHLIPTHWGKSDENHIGRIKPRSIKIVDRFSRVPKIMELSPNSLIVYRDHPLSEQHLDAWANPVKTGIRHADEWAKKIRDMRHGIPREQFIVLGINEFHVWQDDDLDKYGTPLAEGVRKCVDYTVAFLDQLAEHEIRGGALNLSVGWPANDGEDRPPVWEPYEPVLDAINRGNHFLVLHEYWDHYGPSKHWGWWAGRALKCPWDVPIIIGECGMEERVAQVGLPPHKWGWKGWLKPEEYMNQLWEYHNLMLADKRIHSLQVFTWDFSQPFESTDIRPILHMIPENDAWDNMVRDPSWSPSDTFEKFVLEEANEHQAIQFNPNAALQKRIHADGFSPNSPEFSFDFRGVHYVGQRSEDLGTGDVRVYYVERGKWDNVKYVEG